MPDETLKYVLRLIASWEVPVHDDIRELVTADVQQRFGPECEAVLLTVANVYHDALRNLTEGFAGDMIKMPGIMAIYLEATPETIAIVSGHKDAFPVPVFFVERTVSFTVSAL